MNKTIYAVLASVLSLAINSHGEPTSTAWRETFPCELSTEEVFDAQFDEVKPYYNPWNGVDTSGKLTGNVRRLADYYVGTPIVNPHGDIRRSTFPPSVDMADFNGHGVLDLVMIDSLGYFWYFPNTGTKKEPKFSHGILLPNFLTRTPETFQLVPSDDRGIVDLLIGDGIGRLFLMKHLTSRNIPRFENPAKPEDIDIPTRADSKLWCNYLSPALASWLGGDHKDLIIGDGTYASDNLYFLQNISNGSKMVYDAVSPKPLIKGLGHGHFNPRIVDWNGDGKPDLLVGDSDGDIQLYINEGEDPNRPGTPKFKPGQKIPPPSDNCFGRYSRFAIADLNDDSKPDLVLAQTDGTLKLSLNKGSIDAPQFETGNYLKGDSKATPLAGPVAWSLVVPEGTFFYLLQTVGTDPNEPTTYEKDLVLPDKNHFKHALKLSFAPPPQEVDTPYPAPMEKKPIVLGRNNILLADADGISTNNPGLPKFGFALQEKTQYNIHFQVKGEGFSQSAIHLMCIERDLDKSGTLQKRIVALDQEFQLGGSWHEENIPFSYKLEKGAMDKADGFALCFSVEGRGTLYITDLTITAIGAAN